MTVVAVGEADPAEATHEALALGDGGELGGLDRLAEGVGQPSGSDSSSSVVGIMEPPVGEGRKPGSTRAAPATSLRAVGGAGTRTLAGARAGPGALGRGEVWARGRDRPKLRVARGPAGGPRPSPAVLGRDQRHDDAQPPARGPCDPSGARSPCRRRGGSKWTTQATRRRRGCRGRRRRWRRAPRPRRWRKASSARSRCACERSPWMAAASTPAWPSWRATRSAPCLVRQNTMVGPAGG